MKKTIIYLLIIIIVVLGGFFVLNSYIYKEKQGETQNNETDFADSHKNASYVIDGENIKLINGMAEIEISADSASKTNIRYFGNEATGDLDGDGLNDIAFLLTKDNSGSGTFYYIAVAFNSPDGYLGTNTLFLGDRIAPQTTEIRNGKIIVNYAERKPGEPMTAQPSVGVSKYFRTFNGILISDDQ